MTDGWQRSFVAVSALLGEPLEIVAAALRSPCPEARATLRALQSPERLARARAIAQVAADVVRELDAMGWA